MAWSAWVGTHVQGVEIFQDGLEPQVVAVDGRIEGVEDRGLAEEEGGGLGGGDHRGDSRFEDEM